MKRCISRFTSHFSNRPARAVPMVALAAAVLLVSAASLLVHRPAVAQTTEATPNVRQFPPKAQRGEMAMQNHPVLVLNGKTERLSPGARIFDQNNHLVLSGQLVGRDVVVNYVRDGGGQIHQVWLLNAEEAKEKRAGGLATIFNFITGSSPASSTATAP